MVLTISFFNHKNLYYKEIIGVCFSSEIFIFNHFLDDVLTLFLAANTVIILSNH